MNEKKSVGISGTGSFLPSRILTNSDLEKMVETSDEWIRTRSGICERRIVDGGMATSDLAYRAAQNALADAGLAASDLDLIIVASITPDMFFPSTACLVQNALGAKKAAAFDIGAACSGFIYALISGKQFIQTDQYNTVLVIGAETLSRITDWEDRGTCVLLADGAGAAILQPVESGRGIISAYLGADGGAGDLLYIPAGGSREPATHQTVSEKKHFIKMRGNELFRIAVPVLVKAAQEALSRCGLTPQDVSLFIPHQANIRIIDAAAKRLKISQEKIYTNLDKYGNTSAASIAIALDEAHHGGKIKEGDIVLLDAFGGGLTWGACVIKW